MTEAPAGQLPWRVQLALYGVGAFSIGGGLMTSVVVPLWLLLNGASPIVIGAALGCRHFLSMLLAIHGGVLIDRLGPRRVLLVFGATASVVPLLYPLAPGVGAVIALQMLIGLSTALSWVGAQTLVGRLGNDPVIAGRLSLSVSLGGLISPALIGIAWDHLGPWGAFVFMALWGGGLLTAVWFLPKVSIDAEAPAAALQWRSLLPRFADYIDVLRLFALPALAAVLILSMLNLAVAGIQSSFLIVYFDKIGLSGTLIGIVLSTESAAQAVGTLLSRPLLKVFRVSLLMIAGIALIVVSVIVTPLFASFLPLLLISAMRGSLGGIVQPLMINQVSRSVDSGSQGKAVGLRTTVNRVSHFTLPLVMGALVEVAGLEQSFFILGGAILLTVAGVGLYMARSGLFRA
jgi:MFS family permease